jgi:hypothetical protein
MCFFFLLFFFSFYNINGKATLSMNIEKVVTMPCPLFLILFPLFLTRTQSDSGRPFLLCELRKKNPAACERLRKKKVVMYERKEEEEEEGEKEFSFCIFAVVFFLSIFHRHRSAVYELSSFFLSLLKKKRGKEEEDSIPTTQPLPPTLTFENCFSLLLSLSLVFFFSFDEQVFFCCSPSLPLSLYFSVLLQTESQQ